MKRLWYTVKPAIYEISLLSVWLWANWKFHLYKGIPPFIPLSLAVLILLPLILLWGVLNERWNNYKERP